MEEDQEWEEDRQNARYPAEIRYTDCDGKYTPLTKELLEATDDIEVIEYQVFKEVRNAFIEDLLS